MGSQDLELSHTAYPEHFTFGARLDQLTIGPQVATVANLPHTGCSLHKSETHTREAQMPVRGPANRVTAILHDDESMGVSQGKRLIAKSGEHPADL